MQARASVTGFWQRFIGVVDFVSLDIEEHEPAALRAFDLQRYAPRLLCIEAHGRTQDAIYEWMVTHGYRRIDSYLAYDSVNWYFEPAAP
ncbi:MAG: FkbM family methyltransferase [Myxococcales bacterium]|nr:FkbM family methyltransferase [Myxococcales bacterium]